MHARAKSPTTAQPKAAQTSHFTAFISKNTVALRYAEWGRTLYLRYCSKVGCLALNVPLDFEAVIGESHSPRTFAR